MDNMSEMVSILTNVRTVSGMNTSTNINYGGVSGSILDVYGPGEYEWDKFTVKFHSHRGRDDSVMIRWGKNMTDVKKTTDSGNIWEYLCIDYFQTLCNSFPDISKREESAVTNGCGDPRGSESD